MEQEQIDFMEKMKNVHFEKDAADEKGKRQRKDSEISAILSGELRRLASAHLRAANYCLRKSEEAKRVGCVCVTRKVADFWVHYRRRLGRQKRAESLLFMLNAMFHSELTVEAEREKFVGFPQDLVFFRPWQLFPWNSEYWELVGEKCYLKVET